MVPAFSCLPGSPILAPFSGVVRKFSPLWSNSPPLSLVPGNAFPPCTREQNRLLPPTAAPNGTSSLLVLSGKILFYCWHRGCREPLPKRSARRAAMVRKEAYLSMHGGQNDGPDRAGSDGQTCPEKPGQMPAGSRPGSAVRDAVPAAKPAGSGVRMKQPITRCSTSMRR